MRLAARNLVIDTYWLEAGPMLKRNTHTDENESLPFWTGVVSFVITRALTHIILLSSHSSSTILYVRPWFVTNF